MSPSSFQAPNVPSRPQRSAIWLARSSPSPRPAQAWFRVDGWPPPVATPSYYALRRRRNWLPNLATKPFRSGKRLFHARPYRRDQVPIEGFPLFGEGPPSAAAPLVFPQAPARDPSSSASPGSDIVSRFFEHMRLRTSSARAAGEVPRTEEKMEDVPQDVPEELSPSPSMPPPKAKSKKRTNLTHCRLQLRVVEHSQLHV